MVSASTPERYPEVAQVDAIDQRPGGLEKRTAMLDARGRRRCGFEPFADHQAGGDIGVGPQLDCAAFRRAECEAVDLPRVAGERGTNDRFRRVSDDIADQRDQAGQLVAAEREPVSKRRTSSMSGISSMSTPRPWTR